MHNMIKYTLKSQIMMNRKLKDYTKKKESHCMRSKHAVKLVLFNPFSVNDVTINGLSLELKQIWKYRN